uniref:Uncharacterized protein n=1 Tax=Anguilla anguilla TaxID=7936 RepID=A0A0E9XHZ7_ANGAN
MILDPYLCKLGPRVPTWAQQHPPIHMHTQAGTQPIRCFKGGLVHRVGTTSLLRTQDQRFASNLCDLNSDPLQSKRLCVLYPRDALWLPHVIVAVWVHLSHQCHSPRTLFFQLCR